MSHIKKIALVVVALILLAAAIVIARYGYKHQNRKAVFSQTAPTPPAGTLVVQGMPTDLLMDHKAILKSTNSKQTKESIEYTAVFVSKEKMNDLYNMYLKYLNTNDYVIVNQLSQKDFAGLYATKPDMGDVSVSVNQLDKDHVQLTIGFLDKSKK
jgi:hypothetical protein